MLDKVIWETFPFQMEGIMVVHGVGKITLGGDDGRPTWWTCQMSLL